MAEACPAVDVLPPPSPFLKWAGGKRQLLEAMKPLLPTSFGRYIEPFVGGGALFFHLAPKRAILSDTNAELMSAYRGLRHDVESVIWTLKRMPNTREHFAMVRAESPTDTVVRAARMIYLNKTCFNGLYRTNKAGQFNVPFGKYKNPLVCDDMKLRAVSRLLGSAAGMSLSADENRGLLVGDFEVPCAMAVRGDFVYLDPPYLPVKKTSFTAYGETKFDDADHVRLRDVALRLKNRGVHVLLSNADTPRARELYEGFEVHEVKARRNINSNAQGRGAVGELLIR